MNSITRKLRMSFLIIREFIDRGNNKVVVNNTMKTLKRILDDQLSVARFGDAEFNLIMGKDLKYQKYSPDISSRMKTVLSNNDKNDKCLVCIPYAFYCLDGFTIKSKIFWLKYFAQYRREITKHLDANYIYYDSQMSRIYINRLDKNMSKKFFEMWRTIWKGKNLLIVEGKLSRFGVGNTLLDTAKSIRRIICPSENAYDKYHEIMEEITQTDNVDLVIISLGPTATLLAYDLSQKGIWALDTGNLDMEYEWMLKKTRKQVAIHSKYTIEAEGGTDVDECQDTTYLAQISTVIE